MTILVVALLGAFVVEWSVAAWLVRTGRVRIQIVSKGEDSCQEILDS